MTDDITTDEPKNETTEESDLPPDPQPLRKTTRDLPCQLSDDDRTRIADRMAAIPTEIAAVDAEVRAHELAFETAKARHKTAKGDCEGKRLGLEAELAQIGTAWRDGIEVRPVTCVELAHYDSGQIEIIREDTEEMVDTRPMDDAERQLHLVPQETADETDPAPPETAPEDDGPDALDGVTVDRRGDFNVDNDPDLSDDEPEF